jgi:hypothetical protein
MSLRTAIALILAVASTTLTNIASLREHDAAAAQRLWRSCRASAPAGSACSPSSRHASLAGGALTGAGLATLLTNALPIAAGAVVLEEPVPSGAFGGLRVLAFAAVTAGAFLLARPESRSHAS